MSDDLLQAFVPDYNKGLRKLRAEAEKDKELILSFLLDGLNHEDSAIRAAMPPAIISANVRTDENRDSLALRFVDLILNDPDSAVKKATAKALSFMAGNQYRRDRSMLVIDNIVSGLDVENIITQSQTIWMLTICMAEGLSNRMLQFIKEHPSKEVKGRAAILALADKNINTKELGEIGKHALIGALDDPEQYFQRNAATYLRFYLEADVVNVLMAFTQRPDVSDFVKSKANASITWLNNKGIEIVDLLKNLSDEDVNIQLAATKTYQTIRATNLAEIEMLSNLLSSDNEDLSKAASIALVKANNPIATKKLTAAILNGQIHFYPVGYALSNQSRISEMETLAERAKKQASEEIKTKIDADYKRLREYVDRMIRLY